MITDFIKSKRKELNLTQTELAKILDTKQANISRLESSNKTETKLLEKYLRFLRSNGIDLNSMFPIKKKKHVSKKKK